jgi:hypothetical protein
MVAQQLRDPNRGGAGADDQRRFEQPPTPVCGLQRGAGPGAHGDQRRGGQ